MLKDLDYCNFSQGVFMFARSTQEWLNPNGPFKYLHKLNKLRIPYIVNHLPIKGKKVLDCGAGGGILSIPLLKMGAQVTSIDLETSNLDVMKEIRLQQKINNWNIQKGNLFDLKEKFDLVIASEVVEHVVDQKSFVRQLCDLSNDKVYISTINKTILSHFVTITMAEDVLGKIDKGTHNSELFVCPEDINVKGFKLNNVKSFVLNPLLDEFTFNSWPMIHWMGMLEKIPGK
eukprot:NODE_286_length_10728_cov_0.553298.p7 type:complete len:231 gc:universal NODE_286_length_10728_cov_0.553298:4117-3425(-)